MRVSLLAVFFALVGCSTGASPPVAQADAGRAWRTVADPALVDGDSGAYRARSDLPSIPDDATHVFVHRVSTIDGHTTIVRYTSATGASPAVCDGVCVDAHHVDVAPELLPTAKELHAPAWYTAPAGGGHVVIEATPTTSEIGGEQVPCGYARATGHGVFVEGTVVTMLDWSLQWFRTGCGG